MSNDKTNQGASTPSMEPPASGSAHSDPQSLASDASVQPSSNFWKLVLGSVGVVYGDIGTSPIYAIRESLTHVSGGAMDPQAIIGIVSLLIWALIIVVTLKYVFFIMRADNKGEGGTLSLFALAQQTVGRNSTVIFVAGLAGASLFYGDAIITPAISVLSAVEGLKLVTPAFEPFVLPITLVIIVALFTVQRFGTAKIGALFGPITLIWFLVLAWLGLIHISDDWRILQAASPIPGMIFLISNGKLGFVVLGSVFLAVTGAEALYADMGHFGRRPIRFAWMAVVFPALILNYFGQGALALANPKAVENLFFLMVPEWALISVVVLATMATIIASQAVISGAFSLTQQAVNYGLLPRMLIIQTSDEQRGQIYIPVVNWLLLIGVIMLVLSFKTSSSLASAYGIAVTGTMIATTVLAFIVMWKVWQKSLAVSLLVALPFFVVDIAFFAANAVKIADGGYVPVLLGVALMIIMWTWVRGSALVRAKMRKESIPAEALFAMLQKSSPYRVKGTAIFLTNSTDAAPSALLHNLKHNKVLHQSNVLMTIKVDDAPHVAEADQIEITPLCDGVTRLIATLGYMDQPRVPHLLKLGVRKGLVVDPSSASFFLGRNSIKPSPSTQMPIWQDRLFVGLSWLASNATDYFHIPSNRVVEMGSQITV
jgi:KUP system potassium uptake protein